MSVHLHYQWVYLLVMTAVGVVTTVVLSPIVDESVTSVYVIEPFTFNNNYTPKGSMFISHFSVCANSKETWTPHVFNSPCFQATVIQLSLTRFKTISHNSLIS